MTMNLPLLLSDQLPDDLTAKQRLLQNLQRELQLFGYLAIDTPLIEHADLFLIKAGDAAINRLVSFDLTGHTLCIRPEFTAPAARVYLEHYRDQPGAVRLQLHGPILQYENLKHGEITQQEAIGAELINENSAAADAEVIALASKMLGHSALPWSVTIGHSGLIDRFIDRYELDREMRRFVLHALPGLHDGTITLDTVIAQLGLEKAPSPEAARQVIDGRDTELALQALLQATPQRGPTGGRTREEIARRLLEKQQRTDQRKHAVQAIRDLLRILDQAKTPTQLLMALRGDPLEPIAARIVNMFALLEAYQVPPGRITFDLSFTRNLDYYTGVVFEFRAELPTGQQVLLGGGGRYDELIGLLGATDHVPAVGFMLSVATILEALHTDPPAPQPALIVLRPVEAASMPEAIRVAAVLRNAGYPLIVEITPQHHSSWPISHIIAIQAGQALSIEELASGRITEIPIHAHDALIQTVENRQ